MATSDVKKTKRLKSYAQMGTSKPKSFDSNKFAWGMDDVKHIVPAEAVKQVVKEESHRHETDTHEEKKQQFWKEHPNHVLEHEEYEHHEKVHHSLSDAHKAVVNNYKRNSHEVNEHLRKHEGRHPHHERGNEKSDIAHQVNHLEDVTSHKLSHDKTVWRGFGHFDASKLKPGHKIKDHAFTSTSHTKRIAEDFAREHSHYESMSDKIKRHKVIAKIHCPKGTLAHHLDTGSADHPNQGEDEVLLHRGTTFKVHKVTHHDLGVNGTVHHTRTVVHMSVHHQKNHMTGEEHHFGKDDD